jgi:hypothetical protein
MVPKHELLKSIPLYVQEPNYKEGIYELEDHVGEETLSLDLPLKLEFAKNTSCKFS